MYHMDAMRIKKGKLLVIFLFSVSQFIFVPSVNADVGPGPPSMSFYLEYEIPKTRIIRAEIYVCDDSLCSNKELLVDPPEWRGRKADVDCYEDWCWAIEGGSGFGRYHQLVLVFEDAIRPSNVFTMVAYGAEYDVLVKEDGLHIQEIVPNSVMDYFSPLQILLFIPASIITFVTELMAAELYARKINAKIRGVFLANLFSLPILWFVLPFIRVEFVFLFVIAEIFAIIFEAAFLYLRNRKSGLRSRQSILASVIMNIASVVVGILVLFVILGWTALIQL